ncbi:MAG: ABC transporter permease [Pirellulaceae bacterium]
MASIIAIIVWELLIFVLRIPPYLLPHFHTVVAELVAQWSYLFGHFLTTLTETVVGAAIGISAGVLVGGLLAFCRPARWIGEPYLVALQSFPREALAPLLVVWFGFGYAPKIVMSSVICFCPMAIASTVTFSTAPRDMIDLLRCQGATGWQIFRYVRVPYAIPALVAGLRVAVPLSVIGAVIGEFIGGSSGLGYVIATGSAQANTPLVFAAILLLGAMGLSITGILSLLSKVAQRRFVSHLETF